MFCLAQKLFSWNKFTEYGWHSVTELNCLWIEAMFFLAKLHRIIWHSSMDVKDFQIIVEILVLLNVL